MTIPTHEEIAQEDRQRWQDRGCPTGRDTEIWFEAEEKLKDNPAPNTFVARASAAAASESEIENLLSPAESEQQSIQAAMQKESSRAPKGPHHTGPKSKTAQTSKPLWNQPHSS